MHQRINQLTNLVTKAKAQILLNALERATASQQQEQQQQEQQEQQRQAEAQRRQYNLEIEQQVQAFESASDSSWAAATKRYPQFADPNSELIKKYLEIQKRLTEERNPIMDRSDYPKRIADMAATELKITLKQ
ncbi:MAG TPA: hypothetical protein VK639_07610 [Terriglobales bacterium]|nr:hypothetical protein [Terriglobales bacterium]